MEVGYQRGARWRPTCARALRTIAQVGKFEGRVSVLQSDQDPSFKSDAFQQAVRDIGFKHVFLKTYSSTSQAKVERVQQTVVRRMVGKWRTATGRADFKSVLPRLVATYNNTVHGITRVEPAVALRRGRFDGVHSLSLIGRAAVRHIFDLFEGPADVLRGAASCRGWRERACAVYGFDVQAATKFYLPPRYTPRAWATNKFSVEMWLQRGPRRPLSSSD